MTITSKPELGIALIGHAFMGATHSHAWRTAPRAFDLPLEPRMTVVCGRDGEATAAAAERLGWEESSTDWREVLTRDDIDVVDICTPGHTHAEIAVAALEAGKHVLCEKPLANSIAEAEQMTLAAELAASRGVRAMVGFTYRRVPAIQLARQLVAEGRIGEIRHVRAQYLQDWLLDPEAPLSWRLDKKLAGSGALGDIGSHIVDLVQFITGEHLETVTGALRTFVTERPVQAASGGFTGRAGTERGPVTVDDAAVFLAELSGGGLGTFEATRFATGRKNAIRLEINGSRGALSFDFEDMNVLNVLDTGDDPHVQGFRRVVVTEPEHPYLTAWWPPGHGLGYDHGFVNQAADLVGAIASGQDPTPSFADALGIQRVLDAVERSSQDRRSWVSVPGARFAAPAHVPA
ncbi:dehydrogenase [Serinibacter arcticus]|uniref:Dehydrogenase n=1 Tax=Serinibacter arcticus TaxID=1655435 RepID=A0A2U1ZVV4_9MICO|nr:Gfo/Idh/MocA family oxidoreductase [Serinibacter arcticus]PWD51073.1 dehydrogenase [Serinibacter arcticus]